MLASPGVNSATFQVTTRSVAGTAAGLGGALVMAPIETTGLLGASRITENTMPRVVAHSGRAV